MSSRDREHVVRDVERREIAERDAPPAGRRLLR